MSKKRDSGVEDCLGCGNPARLRSGLCHRCQELTAPSRAGRMGRRGLTAATVLLSAGLALGIGAGSLAGCMFHRLCDPGFCMFGDENRGGDPAIAVTTEEETTR